MPTYSQAGKFGPAAVSGAPVGVPLLVQDASGSDAVLFADASKNKTVGPVVQSDDAGLVTFFADPGTYTVRWTGGSTTVVVSGGAEAEVTAGFASDALVGTSGGQGLGLLNPPRLVFPDLRDSVITQFQSGHGWTMSGTVGATYGDDTADYCLGTQSYRVTTGGASATHELRSPTLTAMDLSNSHLVFTVKVDSYTAYSDLQIRFSSNGFADYGYCKPVYTSGSQRWIEPGQWTTITFPLAEIVAGVSWGNGGMQYTGVKANVVWSAITGVRVRLIDNTTNGQITARYNYIGYFPRPAKGMLSIIFDDGRATHWSEAKRYMDRYRIPATSAIIAQSLGTSASAYMTAAQVKELRENSKWAVCAHAYENDTGSLAHTLGYDAITYEVGEADIQRIKYWLNVNGYTGASGICLPHGTWSLSTVNPTVLDMLKKHFDWARTTYPNTLETYPPANAYKMRSFTVTSDMTAAQMLAVVDEAIAAKAWALMQWHNIVTPAPNTTDATVAVFQAFIDGVQTRILAGNLLVRTPQEILQYGAV